MHYIHIYVCVYINNNKEKEAIDLSGSDWDMGDARERHTGEDGGQRGKG